jgi:hypothetical protein
MAVSLSDITFLDEGADFFRLTTQIAGELGLSHEKEFVSAFSSKNYNGVSGYRSPGRVRGGGG